jgi:hypothetical protein
MIILGLLLNLYQEREILNDNNLRCRVKIQENPI